MKIAVLSGKGGTGKTFVSVNLSVAAGRAVYLDCDVEEPDGRLFFDPKSIKEERVSVKIPYFNEERCTDCRKCIEFCRFNALAAIGGKRMLFTEVCHSCGGCALICPVNAITEADRDVGKVEIGNSGDVTVVTGILNLGEASAVPVINGVLAHAAADGLTVIDCPPGSSCSVMESVRGADYCVLVAEPTAFGLHNLRMVQELVSIMKKPCGVIINKYEDGALPVDAFCVRSGVPVLCRIPYSPELAASGAKGEIAVERDEKLMGIFRDVLKQIGTEAAV